MHGKLKEQTKNSLNALKKNFPIKKKNAKKSLTFGKTAQKTLDSMTPYAETIN